MGDIPYQVLSLVIPLLMAGGFHLFTKYFIDSEKLEARIDLWKDERLSDSLRRALTGIENDVQRAIIRPSPVEVFGADYLTYRREREAHLILDLAWADGRDHQLLKSAFNSLHKWETIGQIVCSFGTVLNFVILIGLAILILLAFDDLEKYFALIMGAIALGFLVPLILLFICLAKKFSARSNTRKLLKK